MKKMKKQLLFVVSIVLTATFYAQNIPSYVPTNGLVGWWPFNGNANDESGNGNHGTVNGATLTVDRNGKSNSAYSFDGISNLIKCSKTGPTGNPTLTISFWIKSSQKTYGHLIGYGNNGLSGQDLRVFINGNCGNSIAFDTYDNQKAKTNTLNDSWENYSISYDGNIGNNTTIAKFYKNGILMSSECFNVNNSKTNISQLIPITFGRYHGTVQTGFYNGLLDDIAIYNRALTQQEITSLYTGVPLCNTPNATITPQSSTTFCQDGNVVLSATIGANYTYQWYNNGLVINNATLSSYKTSTNGNYTVTITDGACNASSQPTTVTVNPLPIAKITPQGKIPFCQGSSVDLIASGGTSYLWNNGSSSTTVIANKGDAYYVNVYNSFGCKSTAWLDVMVYPSPTATITPKTTTIIKENESVVLAATRGNGYSYEWYKDGTVLPNAIDSTYTTTTPGNYTVKITTSQACNSTSAIVTVKRFYTLPNYLPNDGLVGWWPFNGNANDESGNENHGTVNGATLTSDRSGKQNSAYNFDGISNLIKCSKTGPTGNPTLTISFWIKSSQKTYGHLIGYGNNGLFGQDLRIFINNSICSNSIAFDTYGNQKAKSNTLSDSWENYSISYDGNTGNNTTIAKFYKNGILMSSECFNVNNSKTNISQLIPITFGRYHGTVQTGFYNGLLDDIAIYNRTLTQEEITALFLGGACSKPSASITPKSTTNIKENESVVLAATKGNGYSYKWFKDGVTIANATDSNYTATTPGNYTVKISTSTTCDSTSAAVTVKRVYALPNYLPANGLVGWWPFNGNANDESGNGYHGTVNKATLTSDRNGKQNSSYDFSTTNSTINTNLTAPNGKHTRTISLWYKQYDSNNTNDQWVILTYGSDEQFRGFTMSVWPKETIGLDIGASYVLYKSNLLQKYQHFVVTYDSINGSTVLAAKIYLNGILLKEVVSHTGYFEINTGNTRSLQFGPKPSSIQNLQTFNGAIDDIAMYNRALSQEEITALYLGEACTTPIATITPQTATSFCSGGSVNLNAATNANYTYQWLNNGAPISAATTATYKATTTGKYNVIVKNNSGCIDTSSVVTVTVTPTPSLPILTGPATLCYNSKAIFKASIAGGTWGVANDYLLISSPQGLFRNNKMPPSNLYKTGVTYTLKSKDQLCSVTAQKSVWIRNVAATSITLTASKQTLKVGEEVAATATTKITGNALFWMSASTSFVSVTGVSPYIALIKGLRPATGANITFSVDDAAKGCRNAAFLPFTVTAAASLVDNESNTTTYTTDLNVYPNPSNGMVTIENIGDAKTISLIDVTGRVLKTTAVNADRMRLDYSTITKGNYFISIQGENLKEMKSIVIE